MESESQQPRAHSPSWPPGLTVATARSQVLDDGGYSLRGLGQLLRNHHRDGTLLIALAVCAFSFGYRVTDWFCDSNSQAFSVAVRSVGIAGEHPPTTALNTIARQGSSRSDHAAHAADSARADSTPHIDVPDERAPTALAQPPTTAIKRAPTAARARVQQHNKGLEPTAPLSDEPTPQLSGSIINDAPQGLARLTLLKDDAAPDTAAPRVPSEPGRPQPSASPLVAATLPNHPRVDAARDGAAVGPHVEPLPLRNAGAGAAVGPHVEPLPLRNARDEAALGPHFEAARDDRGQTSSGTGVEPLPLRNAGDRAAIGTQVESLRNVRDGATFGTQVELLRNDGDGASFGAGVEGLRDERGAVGGELSRKNRDGVRSAPAREDGRRKDAVVLPPTAADARAAEAQSGHKVAAIEALVVDGALTQSAVSRGLSRLVPLYEGCSEFCDAAPQRLKLSTVIDEAGHGRRVVVEGLSRPGLRRCLEQATAHLAVSAPDTGTARAHWIVRFVAKDR